MKDFAYVIIEDMYDKNHGYALATVWADLAGVYGSNFYCGHDFDFAVDRANEENLKRGVTPKEAREIVEHALAIDQFHFFGG